MNFGTGDLLQADHDPDGNHFLGTMEQFLDPNNVYHCSMLVPTFPDSTAKVPFQTFYVKSFEQQFGRLMVLVDFRRSASSIRGPLGLPVEPWPPALVI